jgi:PIN domain nuclease of toxin-antitoxin system
VKEETSIGHTKLLEEVRESLTAPGSRLPGVLHGDPADRILAATARIMGVTLVTKDLKLIDYGIQSYISTIAG